MTERLVHLRAVLLILRQEKFFAAPRKCTFMVSSILFLGYRISADGLGVDSAKIDVILSWPTPTTLIVVRSFHGLASFYRRFIPYFSSITAPITDCIKGKSFHWTEATSTALQLFKQKLTSDPLLLLPDFSLPFKYPVMPLRSALVLF